MPLTEEQARERAEMLVRAYCGWHIWPSVDETLTVDGSGASVQPLPTMRLTAVDAIDSGDELDVDLSSVQWSEAGFLRRDGAAWTDRLRGVVVDVSHGYETAPLDVQGVVDKLTSALVESSSMSTVLVQVGQVRAAVDEDGAPLSAALSSIDKLVLDRYKLPPRP